MPFLVREFVPGVGATVLRACREQAAAAGMSDVLLSTTAQFLAAHRFYEKVGVFADSTGGVADALSAHAAQYPVLSLSIGRG
jgi:hypothetical protein